MLMSLKHLKGYKLLAQDGDVGRVRDFYFDDASWAVRYLVADTGRWLPERQVLVARYFLVRPDWASKVITVTMSKEQIEHSPHVDRDQPVSRRMEQQLYDYYGLPYYWAAGPAVRDAAPASATALCCDTATATEPCVDSSDPHLRSLNEVTHYHIKALDGEVGHAEDFIFNTVDWHLKYLVIDTRNWLPGKKVLVSLDWIRAVDWNARQVELDLSRDAVKDSPPYDPAAAVNREYEARLYDYYGRPK